MVTKSRVENDKSPGATTVSVTLFDTRQGSSKDGERRVPNERATVETLLELVAARPMSVVAKAAAVYDNRDIYMIIYKPNSWRLDLRRGSGVKGTVRQVIKR